MPYLNACMWVPVEVTVISCCVMLTFAVTRHCDSSLPLWVALQGVLSLDQMEWWSGPSRSFCHAREVIIYAATLASSLEAVKSLTIHILYSEIPATFHLYPTLSGRIGGYQNKTVTRYRPMKSSFLTPLHFNLSRLALPAASARTLLSRNCVQ